MKKYKKIKSEIAKKKKEIEKPKYSKGSLNDLQNLIKDLYLKIENLNERLNSLEKI